MPLKRGRSKKVVSDKYPETSYKVRLREDQKRSSVQRKLVTGSAIALDKAVRQNKKSRSKEWISEAL